MKKLYLLRHAQATGGFDVADKDRALTDHGMHQAKTIGASLPDIDLCLCSSALRTCMTYDNVIKGGANIKNVDYQDALYNAPAGDLLHAIQNAGDVENILLIAHNPGIHQVVNMLVNDDDSSLRERLRFDYAPATLCALSCEVTSWADLQMAQNQLLDLVALT